MSIFFIPSIESIIKILIRLIFPMLILKKLLKQIYFWIRKFQVVKCICLMHVVVERENEETLQHRLTQACYVSVPVGVE